MLSKISKPDLLKRLNLLIASYSQITDLESLAVEVQAILDEFIDAEHTGLYLYDYKDDKLKLLVARGFTEEEKREADRTAMDRHPGWVFKNKKTLYIPDVENDPNKISVTSKRSFKVLSRLYIPVMDGPKAVGAFGVVSSQKNKFNEDDISFLSSICTISGSLYGNILKIEELHKAKDQIISLSNFTTQNPHPVIRIGYDRKLWYANQASSELLSWYGRQVGMDINDEFNQPVNEVIRSGKQLEIEIPVNNKIYSLIFNPEPGAGYINVYGRDITRRKKFEAELRRTSLIAEETDNAAIITDAKGFIEWVNKGFTRMTGYLPEESVGKIPGEFLQGKDTDPGAVRMIAEAMQNKESIETDILNYTKSGEPYWVKLQIQPIFDEKGNLSNFISIQNDITRQKKAEREMKSISSRLTALLKGLQEGILVEDENRKIALTNLQFCKMFNVPVAPEMLNGLDCDLTAQQSKVMFKDPEGFIQRIDIILKGKEVVTGDELLLADGRIFERDYTPIMLEDRFMGNLWQYRDISDRKKDEQEIIKSRAEAQTASLAKGRFLANMSHEIRTPLNAIIGLVRLLKESTLSPGQEKLVESLAISSKHLLNVISDILDFSKIESGQVSMEYTTFSLSKLFDDVCTTFNHIVEEKGLILQKKMKPSVDDALKGDPLRIQQVLTNLVNNAIKFTQHGEVSIECELIEKSEDRNRILFQVRDTGIGISHENLGRIFESFQQADESTTRKFGGTGLGLAISKQLVELMGGNLNVSSTLGEGSIFSFILDLEIGDSSMLEAVHEQIAISATALTGKNILVVEDNQFNQFIVRSMLENWGAAVDCADNGAMAVEMLKKNSYDLVLMDKQMPVMDGIEATRIIRLKLKSKVPIIALTADVLKEVIQNCLAAGMNEYIAKPFEPEFLYRKIVHLLGIGTDDKTLKEKEDAIAVASNEEKFYDFSKLNRMLGSDVGQVKIMIEKFLVITPAYITELNRAMKEKDFEAVEKSAHKLKASIDLIAGDELKSGIRLIHEFSQNPQDTGQLAALVSKFTGQFDRLLEQLSEQNQKKI